MPSTARFMSQLGSAVSDAATRPTQCRLPPAGGLNWAAPFPTLQPEKVGTSYLSNPDRLNWAAPFPTLQPLGWRAWTPGWGGLNWAAPFPTLQRLTGALCPIAKEVSIGQRRFRRCNLSQHYYLPWKEGLNWAAPFPTLQHCHRLSWRHLAYRLNWAAPFPTLQPVLRAGPLSSLFVSIGQRRFRRCN